MSPMFLRGMEDPFVSRAGDAVISSNPLSVLLHDICRSRLYFAVGLVAMVVRYGFQLTNGEVIKTWAGDQVRTDWPCRDELNGGGRASCSGGMVVRLMVSAIGE